MLMLDSKRRFLLCAILCALAAAMLFWPGTGGGFLLDDEPTISDNLAVHVASLDSGTLTRAAYSYAAGGGTRPLPMVTFALDYWRAGLDPGAFKATNVVIHALTTLLLAWFFNLLLPLAGWPSKRVTYAAPALALAWAIHPMQVSAVLYVVQRMQTMGTLFLVLALCAYLKMRLAQIHGMRSRKFAIFTALAWALALASKEDSILLPAYTLAMELTVLRFQAAHVRVEKALRRSYFITVTLSAPVLMAALMHYWSWDPYPYRDFSSVERLLSQGRVLSMYIGQILLPLPQWLPFNYDWLQPSRSLLQPATTLPCLLLVGGLLALAWHLRTKRPLLALGLLLFFGGHLITSNVLNLELAFEHRNHFPLIGAVLAVADILNNVLNRMRAGPRAEALACSALLIGLLSLAALRIYQWSTPIRFAEYGTRIAPTSERAWIKLCQIHFALSDGNASNPHFARALTACGRGALLPIGATNLTNLVLLKTINGSIQQRDWDKLFDRLRTTTLSPSNVGIAWHLIRYSSGDPRIDPRNVLTALDIISNRTKFRPEEYAAFGYYAIKNKLDDDAFRYLARAVQYSPPGSGLPAALVDDLRREGLILFASRIQALIDNKNRSSLKN